jgi:glycosyltransferase involved in cell wall biosynthesis
VVHWIFFWISVGFLLYFTLNLLTFTRFSRPLKNAEKNREEPVRGISVLIPARNEENTIEGCVRAVLKNRYPVFEVLVMDDGSTDETYNRVDSIKDERLKIFRAPKKPSGWAGKNWACHQLSLKATYPFFLFIDADTLLTEGALWRINQIFNLTGAEVISGCPKQIPKSFIDKVLLPIMPFLPIGCLPMFKIGSFRFVRSAIHGALVAYDKRFYEKFGGHESVKNQWVDDAALNKVIPRFHGKTETLDVTGIVSCKMYSTGTETVEGIARSMYHSLYGKIPLVLFMMFVLFLVTLFPFLLLAFSHTGEQILLSAGILAIFIGTRLVLDRKYGFPIYSAFLLPITFFVTLYVAFRSVRRSLKKDFVWRGRSVSPE